MYLCRMASIAGCHLGQDGQEPQDVKRKRNEVGRHGRSATFACTLTRSSAERLAGGNSARLAVWGCMIDEAHSWIMSSVQGAREAAARRLNGEQGEIE